MKIKLCLAENKVIDSLLDWKCDIITTEENLKKTLACLLCSKQFNLSSDHIYAGTTKTIKMP